MSAIRSACFLAVFALLATPLIAAGPYDDLLRQLRSDPNVLILINAKSVRGSTFFKREVLDGDAETREVRERLFPVPMVDKAVLASQFSDFDEPVPAWQMLVCESGRPIALKKVAEEQGGKLEHFGVKDAVLLPANAYLYPVSSKIVAHSFPANRPQVVRALTSRTSGVPELSPYLAASVAHAAMGSYPLSLSIDLEHRISAELAEERIRNFGSLAGSERQFPALASTLATMRGARLEVRFGATAKGLVTIEFEEDASSLKSFAKPLFLEVLDRRGARIEDMTAWEVAVSGKSVTFAGDLSLGGLRKIMSLIDTSPGLIHESESDETSTPETDPKKEMAQASLRYYRSVQSLLGELRDPQNIKNFSSGQSGLWYDRYAKKIDQLPILHVDKDLLDYGMETSTRLRIQSAKFRSVGIKAGSETRSPNYWYNYYGNAYGTAYTYTKTESNYDARLRVERAAAANDKLDQLRELDDSTIAIRRVMTERYGVEF